MNFKLSLILVLLGLVVVFIVQNAVTININFLFWSLQTSRALLVIVLLGIGILIGWFLHGIVRFRKKQMRKKKQAATVDKSSSPPPVRMKKIYCVMDICQGKAD